MIVPFAFSVRPFCLSMLLRRYISQYLSIIKNVEVIELQVDGHGRYLLRKLSFKSKTIESLLS
jgi:hypothetical protein